MKALQFKKIAQISLLIGGFTLLLLSIVVVITIVEGNNRNIRYQTTTLGTAALAMFWGVADETTREHLTSFVSIESAIDFYFRRDLSQKGEEIVRFEEAQYSLVVFSGNINNFLSRTPAIGLLLFEKVDDGTYYMLASWVQGMEALFYNRTGRWQAEDRVARDIVLASIKEEATAKINGGIPLYYGVGVGQPPSCISVLGYNPDAIIAFEYRGQEYFFWYYRSDHQFGRVLQQNIDIHSFALADIIMLLDVRVDKYDNGTY